MVISIASEPTNLDASAASSLYDALILNRTGAWLLQRAPDGEIVPYLAESWQISEDGLSYTFRLRSGVSFHDGRPLTAQDYVWTLERAVEKKAAAAFAMGQVENIRVLDELSFEIRLRQPFAPFLTMLVAFGPYLQPLSAEAIAEAGENYSRRPVGVGPFRFVEWITGEVIRLERNPDFSWGPPFAHAGPPFIETLEFRILPEDTVRLAAVETGEVHIGYDIRPRDISILEKSGNFSLLRIPFTGLDPFIALNREVPALQDILVRQALNHGIDRQALVQIVLGGNGFPQYGPISPPVIGYWPGVAQIGYRFDPQRAMSLLEDAGYARNADGIYEREAQPLRFTLLTSAIKGYDFLAAAVADMLLQIGVEIEIEVVESGTLRQRVRFDGDYEMGIGHVGGPDIEILSAMFHSEALYTGLALQDPVLDELLQNTQTTLESAERQVWAVRVQQRIIEQAYIIPLYYSETTIPVSSRLSGVAANLHHDIFLFDAYFVVP